MEIISRKEVNYIKELGCLARIRTRYTNFTPKERTVADYILSNEDVIHRTITEVAKASGSSYGSLDRFCKKLDYSGFQDLKIHLAEELGRRRTESQDSDSTDFIGQAAQVAIREIRNTRRLLDVDRVDRAAELLANASFILTCGVSSSAGIALGIDYRLSRFGIRGACAIDNHMQRHRAATLSDRDVAFLLSFSGSTKEILATAKIAKSSGAQTIAVTNYLESPLTELTDVALVSGLEAEPLSAEIASKVAVEFIVFVLFERVAQLMENSRLLLSQTFEATADRQL